MSVRVLQGDCVDVLAGMEAESFSAIVTDPPYHLTTGKNGGTGVASLNVNSPAGRSRISTGFMGKSWDGGNVAADPATWAAVYRVLKPGAHLVAFGGTRTYHRMVCAIEDAGFEIRDQIGWAYGSGFPKSLDFAAYRDHAGNRIIKPEFVGHQQAEGFGTALKPAWEPIVLARKPLSEGTVAANVLRHGTGALNIDAGRVGTEQTVTRIAGGKGFGSNFRDDNWKPPEESEWRENPTGRWPANLAHDGSPEVMEAFARFGESESAAGGHRGQSQIWGGASGEMERNGYSDTGTAARFFFCGKAQPWEREGSHPTVKPVALMEWLVKLVTPPGGAVLDPFCGTGSTLVACDWLGFDAVGIEQDEQTCRDAEAKIKRLRARRLLGDAPRHDPLPGQLGLFG